MTEEELERLPEAPYAFRPAKRIQRLMFCDALRMLRVIRPLEEYQYVGLGHWQFVDFELMRRDVGVRQMVSIEKDTSRQARYKANRPFGELDLRFGTAYEQLQQIDLSVPTILWLDYTSKLTRDVIRDLQLAIDELPPTSVVATTINCKPDHEDHRLRGLVHHLGDDLVPGDVGEDDLDAEGLPRVQRRILVEQLDKAAATRGPAAHLEQFMFARYVDRTPMAFWAAILADADTHSQIDAVPFQRLEQFVDNDDFTDISVPWLSTREVIGLNGQIQVGQTPAAAGVDAQECASYARLHRWYPAIPLPI